MRRLAFVLFTFLGPAALAADGAVTGEDALFRDGTDLTLEEFQWVKRPVVIFADSPNDSAMSLLRSAWYGSVTMTISSLVILGRRKRPRMRPIRTITSRAMITELMEELRR